GGRGGGSRLVGACGFPLSVSPPQAGERTLEPLTQISIASLGRPSRGPFSFQPKDLPMPLPVPHPLREYTLNAFSSSIGATPKAAYARVPKKGRLIAATCVQDGAVTGTAAIAVAINGSAGSSLARAVTGGSAGTPVLSGAHSTA